MHPRLLLVLLTLSSSLLLLIGSARAEQASSPITILAADAALENTELNTRDKDNTTLTPEDQKETKQDLRITAHIRKTVVRDKSLSINAQNVKIISRNRQVTLRGPVDNKAESMRLQKIAKHTRGVKQVDNQLEIKMP